MLEYLKPEHDGYKTYRGLLATFILGLGAVFVLAVSEGGFAPRQDVPELRLAAYTMPREAYMKILPQFATFWRERTGQHIYIEESYRGSGEQARALVDGDEVDVAALSLEADMETLVSSRLVSNSWKAGPRDSMVSHSVIVMGVRPGNPHRISGWKDLVRKELKILSPNPATSGLGRWNLLALYGAASRGRIPGVSTEEEVEGFVGEVRANFHDPSADAVASLSRFESGEGDVILTYEQTLLSAIKAGADYEIVVPDSTVLVENPVAVVDRYVDRRGTREVAEAFVAFLFTTQAQELFAQSGFRTLDPRIA